MLFLKTNYFLKSKIFIGYVHNDYIKVKQFLCTLKACNYVGYTNNNNNNNNNNNTRMHVICYNNRDSLNIQSTLRFSHLSNFYKQFCTKTEPNDSDVFGDLSYERYESVEMDEAEEQEEKFAGNGRISKKRLYYGDYCKLIRSYLHNKNLPLALSVLDLMKQNHDEPSLYIYRLLLNAFARHGDVKQCFKLFKEMKTKYSNLPPSVYNSLINTCAETNNTKLALERLTYLRQYFYEKQICLNDIHYATLIKAYALHKELLTAFKIADEARDKGYFSPSIISSLFHAIINDKQKGLKYALILWHKMRIYKMEPSIIHYNLLLRAIRDTNFDNLKVNDILVPESMNTQIQITEDRRPDLLDSPPVLNVSLVSMLKSSNYFTSNNANLELTSSELTDKNVLLSLNLNDALQINRIFLFGGVDRLLKRMKNDGVQPNTKTLTLILDLVPPTTEIEEYVLGYITKNKIKIDITLFNVLIKKRCDRKQYKLAKDVLNKIQKHHLSPDIYTFGALAIGCIKHRDGIELLNQMDHIGYAPNFPILDTLFYNACVHSQFKYILDLMEYVLNNKIEPSKRIFHILEKFDGLILRDIENTSKYNHSQIMEIRKCYSYFKITYENWKEKVME